MLYYAMLCPYMLCSAVTHDAVCTLLYEQIVGGHLEITARTA